MNSNILFLDQKETQQTINISSNENKELFIIDIYENDIKYDLVVNIKSNSNIEIIISSLNMSSFHKRFNIVINHLGNNSNSSISTYGINLEKAKTTFDLEAVIKKESMDNFCNQSIKGILLSDHATIEGKPNLIINTNNIKAKHAVAIGCLNFNHLFYLQSKGINKNDAIKLIIMSYFNIILAYIKDEEKLEEIYNKIDNKLGKIIYEY